MAISADRANSYCRKKVAGLHNGIDVKRTGMMKDFDVNAVGQLCRERGIARLELFGSALREDFRSDSDVDLLATIRPGVKCGLFEWVEIKEGLERIFGRPVDLVSRRAVEKSSNPYRRNSILARTRAIYVEG